MKHRTSVQATYLLVFSVFILISALLLNTYPTISSRDVVFRNKQSALLNQTNIMSASLSALERLSGDGVEQVMALVDLGDYDRVLVTDRSGAVLYDTGKQTAAENADEREQAIRALEGLSLFTCRYDGTVFVSRAAAPVMSYGRVIGGVCILERDSDQAELIHSIQGRLRIISLIVSAVSLLVIALFTARLTRRLRELAKAMAVVREGDYAHRVEVRGGDEVAQLSAAFNDMTSRLQSTEELRRRFVSDASHELRTPLASIRLLSDSVVQSERMDPETMREFVTDIGTEAERLQRLTEKLMRLTRMDSGIDLQTAPVDLGKVTERCVHLLTPLAEQKQVTIYPDLEEGVKIRAAEDDMFQIIFNLAENAVKYNSFGGNVFLRLRREGDWASLAVEDTGIGIPEEDLPHIFERFYRVDKARSRAFGGSGLGLSIVHDTVERYKGEIRVERRDTVGTRFIVRFPIEQESMEKEETV